MIVVPSSASAIKRRLGMTKRERAAIERLLKARTSDGKSPKSAAAKSRGRHRNAE